MTEDKFPVDPDDDFDESPGSAWDDADDDSDDDLDDGEEVAHRNGYYMRRLDELQDGFVLDDGLDGAEEEYDGVPAPTWSVGELMRQLITAPDAIPMNEYFALSDLTRAESELVRREWPLIDVEVRRHTLELLVRVAEEYLEIEISALLMVVIDDTDAGVRRLAVEALDDSEPVPAMLGPLIQRLQRDPAEEVRAAAAAALGHFVLAGELDEMDAALAMRAEEVLLGVLTDPIEPIAVQRRALESIAYSGEVGVRQFIEDAYYSPYEEMRVSSLVAMGRSADIRWRRLARAELRNPSPAMRAEAATACGELETKSALPDLLYLLDDDELNVRLSAIFALGRLGGKQARRALENLAATDTQEAQAAEMALEEMLFYTGEDALSLPLYEEFDDDDLDELEPWDDWTDDDDDLGEYDDEHS